MGYDETQLIAQARNGDMLAFRKLVEANKRNVYYLALDMLGNHHDAEDMSQDVFIKAHRTLDSYRGDGKFSSWLYRITVNLSINKKRKKAVSAMNLKDDFDLESNENAAFAGVKHGNPERSADAMLAQDHIESALGALSGKERAVFVLRHFKDLPLKEIATTLSLAEGTVKSLLFRAIRKLQEELSFYRTDFGLEATE